jgi:hypothetical protein
MKSKEIENRIIAIPISWEVLQQFIVEKIEGLPKDVRIMGVRHDIFSNNDVIGLYSKEFQIIPLGIQAPIINIVYECSTNKEYKNRILKMRIERYGRG